MGTSKRWPRDDFNQAVWDCPNLSPNERAVLKAYAEYAKSGTDAGIIGDEMIRRTGIKSRNTIHRTVNGLVKKGWLVLIRKGTIHRAARYRIAIPDDCPDDTHRSKPSCVREKDTSVGALVSPTSTQGEAGPLVSSSGAGLVSSSGAGLVSSTRTQSDQDQFSNQSSAREGSGKVGEALFLVATELGLGLDESQKWIDDKIKKASKPPTKLLGYIRTCVATEKKAREEATGNPWLDGKPATSKGGPPPVGTRGDTSCRKCGGSGLLEDENGMPVYIDRVRQKCPDCTEEGAA